MQVVTNENFQQLIETRSVPEYKPPEPAKAVEEPAKTVESDKSSTEQSRDETGKFTKTTEGDKTTTAADSSPDDDAEANKDLSEVVRRKIDKKHRQMKEAEEFARTTYGKQLAAETRADNLQRELEAERARSRPATASEDKPPKPEDFANVGEYTDALVDYRVKKRFEADKLALEQQRQADEKSAREQEFAKRMVKAKEQHDDFDEVLQSIAGTDLDKVPTDVAEYIQESDYGPNLLYHLAKTPDDLQRFRKLSPRRFIAELGKLETRWEKPAEPEKSISTLTEAAAAIPSKAVSKAPAPIAALSSDKSTVVSKDPSDMSIPELRAHERQREAERRARH